MATPRDRTGAKGGRAVSELQDLQPQLRERANRIMPTLQIPPSETADDYLLLQETIIGLLGPELLEYQVVSTGDDAFQIRIQRCFAHENVARAGVADLHECGIFSRVTGWLDASGLKYEMTPPLGKCQKTQGQECSYSFKLDLS